MIRGILILFVFIMISGVCCTPKDVTGLPKEKAADLFLDLTLSDQIINLYDPRDRDSMKLVIKQSLLKIHNISQEELDANLSLYMSDFEKFGDLTDLMLSKYDTLEMAVDSQILDSKDNK